MSTVGTAVAMAAAAAAAAVVTVAVVVASPWCRVQSEARDGNPDTQRST